MFKVLIIAMFVQMALSQVVPYSNTNPDSAYATAKYISMPITFGYGANETLLPVCQRLKKTPQFLISILQTLTSVTQPAFVNRYDLEAQLLSVNCKSRGLTAAFVVEPGYTKSLLTTLFSIYF